MIRFVILVMFAAPCLCCCRATSEATKLNWLAGTWVRQNMSEGKSAFESWQKSPTGLIGEGISLHGADTVFVERLKIIAKDNSLFYVADVPENPNPVFFKIITIGKASFTCENPDHDFPKKIEYNLEGNKLTVRISGDGRSTNFLFVRK